MSLKTSRAKGIAVKQTAKQESIVALENNAFDISYILLALKSLLYISQTGIEMLHVVEFDKPAYECSSHQKNNAGFIR